MLVAARPNETMRPAPCAAHPLRTRCAALGRAPGCSSRTKGPSCCQSCPSCRTRRCARPLPSRSRPDRDRCMRGRRQTPSLRVPLLLRSVHPRDRCHLRAPLSARDGQRDVRAAPRGRSRVAAFVCRECRIGVLRPPLFWTIKTEECAWRPTLRVARTDEGLRLYRRATAAARARRTSRRARGTSTAGGVAKHPAYFSALVTRGVPRLPRWPTPPSALGECAGALARARYQAARLAVRPRDSVLPHHRMGKHSDGRRSRKMYVIKNMVDATCATAGLAGDCRAAAPPFLPRCDREGPVIAQSWRPERSAVRAACARRAARWLPWPSWARDARTRAHGAAGSRHRNSRLLPKALVSRRSTSHAVCTCPQ